MSGEQHFICQTQAVKQGDLIKALDSQSKILGFYKVEDVWNQHVTVREIPEHEAGANPKTITMQEKPFVC